MPQHTPTVHTKPVSLAATALHTSSFCCCQKPSLAVVVESAAAVVVVVVVAVVNHANHCSFINILGGYTNVKLPQNCINCP